MPETQVSLLQYLSLICDTAHHGEKNTASWRWPQGNMLGEIPSHGNIGTKSRRLPALV